MTGHHAKMLYLKNIYTAIGALGIRPFSSNRTFPCHRNFVFEHTYCGRQFSSSRESRRSNATDVPYGDWSDARTRAYIRAVTEVTRAHLTPEVGLHLVTPRCALWAGRGDDCLVPDPFWAFYWPGGQALTRYILDHPAVVRGRTVLDVGSGCGASSIAAVLGGAKEVIANDICPVAATAIKMNSTLNNVSLTTDTRDLIGKSDESWDLIFLGDMFYDEEFTNHVAGWLADVHSQGKDILIGDPGRVYLKNHPIKGRLQQVFTVDLPRQTTEENYGITQGFVWKFVD